MSEFEQCCNNCNDCDSCSCDLGSSNGTVPQVGFPAPSFYDIQSYHKGEFKKISLEDYEGKWLVLFFYPRDFTFICPTEIEGFAKQYPDFQAANCEILAASTDSEHCHKAWYETDDRLKGVAYPILADTTQEVSDMYGVLDIDGSSQRGTFIIDLDGILQYSLVSSGNVGRSIDETLRVVKALQTGERCPVSWKEGDKTLGKP
jgi:alkyl hydroperoxide reductase subunit AhpC